MKFILVVLSLLFACSLHAQSAGSRDRFYGTFSQGGVESGGAVSRGTLGAEMDLDYVSGLKLNSEVGMLKQWAGDNTGVFSIGLAYHLAPKRKSKFDPFLAVGYSRLFDRLHTSVTTIHIVTNIVTRGDLNDHFPPGELEDRTFSESRTRFISVTESIEDVNASGQDFVHFGGGVDYWFHKKVALRLSGRGYSPTDGAKQSLADMAIGVVFRP